MKTISTHTLLVLGILGCQNAASTTPEISKTAPVTSNSKENEYAVQKVVASDDDETKQTDDNVTSRIREKIVNEKLLTHAQEIIIVTKAGKVTLQGVVKTAEEKQQVEDIARAIAGTENLWSQLEVE